MGETTNAAGTGSYLVTASRHEGHHKLLFLDRCTIRNNLLGGPAPVIEQVAAVQVAAVQMAVVQMASVQMAAVQMASVQMAAVQMAAVPTSLVRAAPVPVAAVQERRNHLFT